MLESNGTKRTIASIFAVIACTADFIPVLAPFKSLIVELAGLFGAVGLGHSVISRTKLGLRR